MVEHQSDGQLKGVHGWLMLYNLGLWVGFILSALNLRHIDVLPLPLSILNVCVMLLSAANFWILEEERRVFPIFAQGTLIALFLAQFILYLTGMYGIASSQLVISGASTVAWCIYFSVSERVKNTFVN
jgi:hypothetical protein